jgi:hypothetical protein
MSANLSGTKVRIKPGGYGGDGDRPDRVRSPLLTRVEDLRIPGGGVGAVVRYAWIAPVVSHRALRLVVLGGLFYCLGRC